MSPMPPSSPTTWTPGRDDSKNSVDLGQVDAALGGAEDQPDGVDRALGAQRPWPMQWSAWISLAAPSTMPRMSPSGQALRQERLPMQMSGSMTGWSERARCWFFSTFCLEDLGVAPLPPARGGAQARAPPSTATASAADHDEGALIHAVV